jgi:hypothetical protein
MYGSGIVDGESVAPLLTGDKAAKPIPFLPGKVAGKACNEKKFVQSLNPKAMLVHNQSPKQSHASGRDYGFQQPLLQNNYSSYKKKIRPWAYHIILKVKT